MTFQLFALVVLFGGAAGLGHKSNWSSVCELEAARGAVEKAERTTRNAVAATAPQTPTLRLGVEGRRSDEGVPLTVAAGTVVYADYYVGGGKRHLTTAISLDGKPSCPGTGHRSKVALEMPVPVTTRALRKRGHHHRHHRFKRHTSHEHESKYSEISPSERVVIDAVLCDGRKKIAKQRAVTRVVEGSRVLDRCPAGCRARDANASCVFAHLVENKKELKRVPETCVEVCFSKLAIKYVWRADVSRGGDARDKLALERCRTLHLHKLAAWWSRHRNTAPLAAAAEGGRSVPVPVAQSLDHCAVVGSGHSLRCGSPFGGTIDSYDAVFRVNKVQLQTENRNAYACNVGSRVDFAINALTGGQFEELANTFTNNSIGEKFLAQHAEVMDSLSGLGLCGNQAVNFVIAETFRNLRSAVAGTTSRRWRRISTPSSRRNYGRNVDGVGRLKFDFHKISMAWDA